ncbi:MAG: calcium/sodium antiporter [Sandaracinaceae bacterium]
MIAALELVLGLAGLVASGFAIVRGASVIGARLGLPKLVIGLTIVAAGTSAPELAVVWRAADQGESGLALGSVVGSNIANVLLVLGVVALLRPINVSRQAVMLDAPVMIAASLLVLLLGLDGHLTQPDGFLLVLCLIVYVTTTILVARRNERRGITSTEPRAEDRPSRPGPDPARGAAAHAIVARFDRVVDGVPGAVALFATGALCVALSAERVVNGAGALALGWGMSELVVGLTVLAVGTSAPEIATSLIAALRGHADVALGNAIGSNVFNLLFVLGLVSATHSDLPVEEALQNLNLPVMLAAAVLALPYAITQLQIERLEGTMFLVIYAAYTAYLVLDGTNHPAAATFSVMTIAVITPLSLLTIVVATVRRRPRARRPG